VVFGHPAYYPRFGFSSARRIGLRCKWSRDDDHFMYLELEAGHAALVGGEVNYRPEFDRFA
jgi:putative acetyltransferase